MVVKHERCGCRRGRSCRFVLNQDLYFQTTSTDLFSVPFFLSPPLFLLFLFVSPICRWLNFFLITHKDWCTSSIYSFSSVSLISYLTVMPVHQYNTLLNRGLHYAHFLLQLGSCWSLNPWRPLSCLILLSALCEMLFTCFHFPGSTQNDSVPGQVLVSVPLWSLPTIVKIWYKYSRPRGSNLFWEWTPEQLQYSFYTKMLLTNPLKNLDRLSSLLPLFLLTKHF